MDVSILTDFNLLETTRFTLTVHSDEDIDDMYVLRSDPDVMQYLDTEPAKDKETVAKKIKEIQSDFQNKKGLNLVIRYREQEESIGYMSLWKFDIKNHRAEIGYALKKAYWNKGIATECAVALINFAFEKMKVHSIMANINEDNTASRKLLDKLGFQQEAYFREDYYFRGKFLNSVILCLIQSDWEEHPIYRLP